MSGKEPTYKLVPFPEEQRRIDIGDFYADYGKIEDATQRKMIIAYLKTEDPSVNLCPEE